MYFFSLNLNYYARFKDVKDLDFIKDYDYIEGAIIIDFNGRRILGFKYWDLIDQLWSYIISAVEQITEHKMETHFYFPDQPVRIDFKLISQEHILLSIDNQKQIFNKSDLLLSLTEEACCFWQLFQYCPMEYLRVQSQAELERIKKIIKML